MLLLKSKSTESDGIKSLPLSLPALIPSLEVAVEDISVLYPSSCFRA